MRAGVVRKSGQRMDDWPAGQLKVQQRKGRGWCMGARMSRHGMEDGEGSSWHLSGLLTPRVAQGILTHCRFPCGGPTSTG